MGERRLKDSRLRQGARVVVALLTAHNRRDLTLRAIRCLHEQEGLDSEFRIKVVLVDDGSTDGTSEAVLAAFPSVNVVRGDGGLFWCGGMRMAYKQAENAAADFYLMLNDDTFIYRDAIRRVLSVYDENATEQEDFIIVGSTKDPGSGKVTYGGVVKKAGRHPFRYTLIEPAERALSCDTMNGNFVLIHHSVVSKIGFLDERYTHRFGDTDYGLMAVSAGSGLLVAPGFVGECEANDPKGDWDSGERSFYQRVAMFFDVKGMPLRESLVFCRKHGGRFWLIYWLMPVVRGLFFPARHS